MAARKMTESLRFSPTELQRAGIHTRLDGQQRSIFTLLGGTDICADRLAGLVPDLLDLRPETLQQLRNDALYHQYADRQARDAEILRADEAIDLPQDLDYARISGLSAELRAKLTAARPATLAAAAKIEGMTPAALTLLVAMARAGRRSRA